MITVSVMPDLLPAVKAYFDNRVEPMLRKPDRWQCRLDE